MAEAFMRMHGGDRVEVYSSGSRPSGQINPKAIQFMKERNYDLTTHSSKALSEIPNVPFDAAITMGCGDECPLVNAAIHEDWGIPDPKNLPADGFREIRDLIETKVKDLLGKLGA